MKPSSDPLAQVCGIAHDTSWGGAGRSLRDSINASGYRQLRPSLTEAIVADYVSEHPDLVMQWSMYSDNKRTGGGWHLVQDGVFWIVGRVGSPADRTDQRRYTSAADACAHFILLELDFWGRSS